jgi:glycosyltransferase involved in cell wall biosynthesis
MKIAIDLTFSPHGGSIPHAQEFIQGLYRNPLVHEVVVYTKRKSVDIIGEECLSGCTVKLVKLASFGIFYRLLWVQFIFPFILIKDSVDVLFCPGNFSPILKTTKIKSQWIATIGPFCKEIYVNMRLYDRVLLKVNKWVMLLSGYSSNVVIHESGYSYNLFVDFYYFNKLNQHVLHVGRHDYFTKNLNQTKGSNELNNITNNDLLCVSHLYSYKNIENLILAFSKCNETSSSNLYIVGIVGDRRYYENLKKIVSEYQLIDKVIFTGKANKKELRYAYSVCKLFIFPSLCESCAYILIEAMSCGAPILAAKKTAIPFTCDSAAVYFDPYSVEDLVCKMNVLLCKTSLIELRKKSVKRASQMLTYNKAVDDYVSIIVSKKSRSHGK